MSHNYIHYILDNDNVRLHSYDLIASSFVDFYTNLFTSTSPSFPCDLQGLILPMVGADINLHLCSAPSFMEIHKAMFSMANNKSPVFYKTYWHIIGKDVHTAVLHFFSHGQLSVEPFC